MGQILYRGARATEALCRLVGRDAIHDTIRHITNSLKAAHRPCRTLTQAGAALRMTTAC